MPASMTREEFADFYKKTADPLYRYILVRVSNQTVAEDIASQCYANMLEQVISGSIKQPKPYLYQIARNQIIEHFRKNKREVSIDDEQMLPIIENRIGVEAKDAANVASDRFDLMLENPNILRLVKTLSEEQQKMIHLRYVEQLQWSEIGTLMEKSVVGMRVFHYRTLQEIRTLIERDQKKKSTNK